MSDVTTQVTFKTQFAACLDKQSFRYALGEAQIIPAGDGDGVYAVGTDSKQLCVRHEEGFTDKPVRIPHAILPSKKPGRLDHVVSLNGRWETNEGKFLPRQSEESRFPPVNQVINADASKCVAVSLDVDKLVQMAKALGGTEITLLMEIPKSRQVDGAIRVMTTEGSGAFGVLMPLAMEEDKKDISAGIRNTRERWNRYASTFNAAWESAFANPVEVQPEPETAAA